MARSTGTRTKKVQLTITDEEYEGLLAIRLAAKHAFEAGTGTEQEWKDAQAVVRKARKVRRAEGAVVERFRQVSAPMHNAKTAKPAVKAVA